MIFNIAGRVSTGFKFKYDIHSYIRHLLRIFFEEAIIRMTIPDIKTKNSCSL
jgi:hypothetical protein